jgi:hypothetical protein
LGFRISTDAHGHSRRQRQRATDWWLPDFDTWPDGTPYEIDCDDRIVFLEDVDEEPHNIDRILTQMILAGKFDRASGIIIGDCSGCRPGGSKRNILPLNSSLEGDFA